MTMTRFLPKGKSFAHQFMPSKMVCVSFDVETGGVYRYRKNSKKVIKIFSQTSDIWSLQDALYHD